MRPFSFLLVITGLFLTFSCEQSDDPGETPVEPKPSEEEIEREEIVVNPTGFAPLTALVNIAVNFESTARVKVVGKNGPDSDVIHDFDEAATTHELPILGLYGGNLNQVEVTLTSIDGQKRVTRSFEIRTDPLISDLPEIEILKADADRMLPGMDLVSYYGHNGRSNPQKAFIFDRFGDIRWYLDYAGHPQLRNLFYDVGIERLENGNLIFGDRWTNIIYEANMLGEVLNTWEMPGFRFHHVVVEKPNGNFLATVNKIGIRTEEDHIIEIDRTTKQIINVWDLRESLDQSRFTFTTNDIDWIHVNAIVYDESDNTIIITGRTQGVFKLTENNELVWILNPHLGWDKSGNGTDLTQFLMQPLSADNTSITDERVLSGFDPHPEFGWPWYAHAPLLMPNGNLMLFDNGERRNFGQVGAFSRAVEFEIDDEVRTVKQVWSFGEAEGENCYSRIVSDVDFFPAENRVIFSSGAIVSAGPDHGKIIELDYDTKEIFFRAKISPPQSVFDITFHRTQRLMLYP